MSGLHGRASSVVEVSKTSLLAVGQVNPRPGEAEGGEKERPKQSTDSLRLSGDIVNCRPIYLPPHPVMRSVASNASYELPAPLLPEGIGEAMRGRDR